MVGGKLLAQLLIGNQIHLIFAYVGLFSIQ